MDIFQENILNQQKLSKTIERQIPVRQHTAAWKCCCKTERDTIQQSSKPARDSK